MSYIYGYQAVKAPYLYQKINCLILFNCPYLEAELSTPKTSSYKLLVLIYYLNILINI